MELTAIGPIINLGVAGFAIWIMWKMYEVSSRRFAEKDALHAQQLSEEIAKRDAVEKEVRDTIMKQLAENTQALLSMNDHIKNHH